MTKRLTQSQFSLQVEQVVSEQKMEYVEACVSVAEAEGVDLEDIPSLLSPALRDKLEHEAVENNRLKQKATTGSLAFLM